MNTVRLQYPLETPDKRFLIPSGTSINRSFLKNFLKDRPATAARRTRLLGHRRIEADMRDFCREKPFDALFYSSPWTREVFKIIADCHMSTVFFNFLDYFEKSDSYTYRHSLVVYALSVQLARLVEDPDKAPRIGAMGPTHDFGKICVPHSMLVKSTPLTGAERACVEHHAMAGYLLLAYYRRGDGEIAPCVARDHHERRDGSGYPSQKKRFGSEAEIAATADVYDALISPRPYRRQSYDNRTALEELTTMAESGKIRPRFVRGLVALNRRSPGGYRTCKISREKRGRPPAETCYGMIEA
jgi:HD-GYP domain-containing protein (c-di-GMP phosphodiesterase class II)